MAKFIEEIAQLDGLLEIESKIKSVLKSSASLLEEIPQYLLNLGGKRMRPVLCLLVNKALSSDLKPDLIKIAAGIELIHMATLLHDDIIDDSNLRRGKPSAFKVYGSPNTLLAGDFLLVRAFGLCSELDPFIVKATEAACVELTEGEILELAATCEDSTLENYISIASKKTASLFALSASTSAFINNSETQNWYNFGLNLGIAFQILDDILDVTSSEKVLGKPLGTDLKEKKASIVNILWLQSGSVKAKELLLNKETPSPEDILAAIADIKVSGSLESSKEYAISYANKAKECLNLISNNNKLDTELLSGLIEYTLERLN